MYCLYYCFSELFKLLMGKWLLAQAHNFEDIILKTECKTDVPYLFAFVLYPLPICNCCNFSNCWHCSYGIVLALVFLGCWERSSWWRVYGFVGNVKTERWWWRKSSDSTQAADDGCRFNRACREICDVGVGGRSREAARVMLSLGLASSVFGRLWLPSWWWWEVFSIVVVVLAVKEGMYGVFVLFRHWLGG